MAGQDLSGIFDTSTQIFNLESPGNMAHLFSGTLQSLNPGYLLASNDGLTGSIGAPGSTVTEPGQPATPPAETYTPHQEQVPVEPYNPNEPHPDPTHMAPSAGQILSNFLPSQDVVIRLLIGLTGGIILLIAAMALVREQENG